MIYFCHDVNTDQNESVALASGGQRRLLKLLSRKVVFEKRRPRPSLSVCPGVFLLLSY